mgnify:FL=1
MYKDYLNIYIFLFDFKIKNNMIQYNKWKNIQYVDRIKTKLNNN